MTVDSKAREGVELRARVLAEVLAGVGVGVLLGLILGLAASEVVKAVLAGLVALLGGFLGLKSSSSKKSKSEKEGQDKDGEAGKKGNEDAADGEGGEDCEGDDRAAATTVAAEDRNHRGVEAWLWAVRAGCFGLACAAAVVGGVFLRTHGVHGPSVEQQIQRWKDAGFSDPEAKARVTYQELALLPAHWSPNHGENGLALPPVPTAKAGRFVAGLMAEAAPGECTRLSEAVYPRDAAGEWRNAMELEEGAWKEAVAALEDGLGEEELRSGLREIYCRRCPSRCIPSAM